MRAGLGWTRAGANKCKSASGRLEAPPARGQVCTAVIVPSSRSSRGSLMPVSVSASLNRSCAMNDPPIARPRRSHPAAARRCKSMRWITGPTSIHRSLLHVRACGIFNILFGGKQATLTRCHLAGLQTTLNTRQQRTQVQGHTSHARARANRRVPQMLRVRSGRGRHYAFQRNVVDLLEHAPAWRTARVSLKRFLGSRASCT